MKRLLIAGALALALAGCASSSGGGIVAIGHTSPAQATTVAAAEVAYTNAAHLEKTWAESGKATPAQAKFAKDLDNAVYADIVAGRTAVANNDSAAVAVALKLFNQALPELTGYVANGGTP